MRLSPTRSPRPPNARSRFCRARRSRAQAGTIMARIIVVAKLDDAAALVDRIAPEHLEIATADPEALLARVRHAGAIFLGRHTPEAMGDYIAGPNHVLPTSRSARFSSGLSVLDFMKRTTLLRWTPAPSPRSGPTPSPWPKPKGWSACPLHRRAAERTARYLTHGRPFRIAADRARRGERGAPHARDRAGTRSRDLRSAGSQHFTPEGSPGGPYRLVLGVEENRLVFDIALEDGEPHGKVMLSLTPFRRVIKDYFLICESYYKAIRTAPPSQIEALDMGRRGLARRRLDASAGAAGGQDRDRFRHRAAAVHADLRAASEGLRRCAGPMARSCRAPCCSPAP